MAEKVLVTGADGFIGSHLVEELAIAGKQVRAMVLYNSFTSWGWLESLDPDVLRRVEVVQGDVRDWGSVFDAMQGIDVVYHLGALVSIPYSYASPRSFVETNIGGTLNVLEAARMHRTPRLLITSTSEVYGTAMYVPIDEGHPFQGQSPYSATKIGADRLAESYYRSFGIRLSIVRPFNTYGPRQSARAVIPTIITQLLAGYSVIRLGSLEPTRDLVFVKDTVQGFVKIAASEEAIGEEINIATERETSIGVLADTIIGIVNPEARVEVDRNRLRPSGSEVERLLGSNAKIRSLTGWEPKYELKAGLEATIEWFRDSGNLGRYKPQIYAV